MKTSRQGIELVKQFEGFAPTAYICPAGKKTVGFGHVVRPGESIATPITQAQATGLLISDLAIAERAVESAVIVPLSQEQFDALVSLTFNIGAGAFAKSTLVKRLNEGKYHDAAAQFDRWVHAGKKKLPGLVKRRKAEKDLFLEGTSRPKMKPLAKSRTVVGSSVAGVSTIASEIVVETKDQIEPLAPYADSLRWIFLALALAGIAFTIYARVNDRKKGLV